MIFFVLMKHVYTILKLSLSGFMSYRVISQIISNDFDVSIWVWLKGGFFLVWFMIEVSYLFWEEKITAWINEPDEDELPKDDFQQYSESNKINAGLKQTLAHMIAGGSRWDDELDEVEANILSQKDAIAVCLVLRDHGDELWEDIDRMVSSPESQETYAVFYHFAIPLYLEKFDEVNVAEEKDHSLLMSLVGTLARYEHEAAVEKIIEMSKYPSDDLPFGWNGIFKCIEPGDDTFQPVIDWFAQHEVEGFASVVFLDWMNEHCLDGAAKEHLFDSAKGRSVLRKYITDEDPELYTYAGSAVVALSFMEDVEDLLELAQQHQSNDVVIEANWALAKQGNAEAVKNLQMFCEDWRKAAKAATYLTELKLDIPDSFNDTKHQAKAEMAEWLKHPSELTELPETLEVVDQREIYWPPVKKRILTSLLKWTHDGEEGIGMVGSTTFCLFGDTTCDKSVIQNYAQYCKWELATRGNEEDELPLDRYELLLREKNPKETWE